jgi:predicted PurR-regulated permease PerM
MPREFLFRAFFFFLLGFLLYQAYLLFSGFLAAAFWAGVLALVFDPLYRRLLRWLRRPGAAAGLMTAAIFSIVVLPALGLGVLAVEQAQSLYAALREAVESGEAHQWLQRWRTTRVAALANRLLPPGAPLPLDFADLGVRTAKAAAEFLVGQLGAVARNLLAFLVNFLLSIVILFFFFRDGERLYRGLKELIPMEPEHKDAILARFYETLSAVVRGLTATAAVQGCLAGAAFWALDVPFALLLALASALASFVPVGGAALVWVPTVLYLLSQGSWGRALALAIWGTFAISLADNIVKPLVIGSRTQVPTLFLFLGLLGGLQVYGILGVFLGPAVLATILAAFRIYREEIAPPAGDRPPGPGS